MSNTLNRRLDKLEAANNPGGRPAYVVVWDDDDQATVDAAIAKRRAEMPDAGEIVALVWGRST